MLIETELVDWSKKIVWLEGGVAKEAFLFSKNVNPNGYTNSSANKTYGVVIRGKSAADVDIIKYVSNQGIIIGSGSSERRIYNIADPDKQNTPLAKIDDKLVEDLGTF